MLFFLIYPVLASFLDLMEEHTKMDWSKEKILSTSNLVYQEEKTSLGTFGHTIEQGENPGVVQVNVSRGENIFKDIPWSKEKMLLSLSKLVKRRKYLWGHTMEQGELVVVVVQVG